MESDITIDYLRGNECERLGTRTGSLCIFDDIDKITNREQKTIVDKLKDTILATGRDHLHLGGDVDLIVTNHSSLDYRRTQELLSQANYVVLFPQATSKHQIETVAGKYMGLSRESINRILDSDSRYIIIHRSVPIFVQE